jgi:phosphoglycerate dehydrogenase-like enzyme
MTRPDSSEIRVAVLDDYVGAASDYAEWKRLPSNVRVTFFREHIEEPDKLVEALAPYDVVCAMRERTAFPRPVLSSLPRLRLIMSASRFNASIDYAAARQHGILVCGTERYTSSTPEMTWALICATTRFICVEDRSVRNGGWQTKVGLDLHGATLGIVGLGEIGTKIAWFGRMFGMRIIAWSENLTEKVAKERGADYVAKEELFRRADVVSVHLKLSERTRGIVGAAEFAVMKPTAHFINTSRGPIVSEAALIDALKNNRIAGAALDVYDREPLPLDHPFRSLENLTLSPHSGYATQGTFRTFYGGMLEGIEAWLAGAPIRVQS